MPRLSVSSLPVWETIIRGPEKPRIPESDHSGHRGRRDGDGGGLSPLSFRVCLTEISKRLEGVDEKFLDRIASVQTSRQPYVVKYVADALMEDEEEGEDAMALTEEQKGFLFLLLKTVIDALDQPGIGLTLQKE